MISPAELKKRQALPLGDKIQMSLERIEEWYEAWDGQVYVAFSGGKDSTVLLHLVRSWFPDVPAVFVDTGLEYPEIKSFVKTTPNVTTIRPKMPFNKVIDKYGYPVVSKEISMGLDRYRNTNSKVQRDLRLYGGINPTSGKKQRPTIPKKWHYLTLAPFDCSEKCCNIMKKNPFSKYEKSSGRKPLIGTMTTDSSIRRINYLKTGCLAFNTPKPKATPLSFWDEDDVWTYLITQNIPYSKIYLMGYDRTGCIFCMFGVHMEQQKTGTNRFVRMKRTHPKLHAYCMEKLGIRDVLEYLNLPTE